MTTLTAQAISLAMVSVARSQVKIENIARIAKAAGHKFKCQSCPVLSCADLITMTTMFTTTTMTKLTTMTVATMRKLEVI